MHGDVGPAPPIEMMEGLMEDPTSKKIAALPQVESGLSPPVPFNVSKYEDGIQEKIATDADVLSSSNEQMPTLVAGNDTIIDVTEFEEDDARNLSTLRTRIEVPFGGEENADHGEDGSSPQAAFNRVGLDRVENNDALVDADQGGNESLPRITEAYLVEEESRRVINLAYAETIPPWYKQTRTRIFFVVIFLVVSAAAIVVALTISSSGGSVNNSVTVIASTAPSVSTIPTVESTTNSPSIEPTMFPSSSFEPSSSPTTCANEILSNAQKIDLPLLKPSDPEIAVDERNMVIVARDLGVESASVYIIFYSLKDGRWERESIFIEDAEIPDDDDSRLYSVALSGKTAFIGLPHAEGVFIYEQNSLGVWGKAGEFLSKFSVA